MGPNTVGLGALPLGSGNSLIPSEKMLAIQQMPPSVRSAPVADQGWRLTCCLGVCLPQLMVNF